MKNSQSNTQATKVLIHNKKNVGRFIKNNSLILLLLSALVSIQVGSAIASPHIETFDLPKGRVEMVQVNDNQAVLLGLEVARYEALLAIAKTEHQHNINQIFSKQAQE